MNHYSAGNEASARLTGRQRLWFWLRVGAASGLLLIIGINLPWQDELNWRAGQADVPLTIVGRIEGEWRGDQITFHVSEKSVSNALGPPGFAPGQRVEVERATGAGVPIVQWSPGMITIFRSLDPWGLVVASLLLCLGVWLNIVRWRILLAGAGCPTTLLAATRMSLIGMYFNLVVPGLTGGDVVRAVMVARAHPGRRTPATVSVVLDRVIGLATLALIAAVVVIFGDGLLQSLKAPLLVLVSLGLIGVVLYGSTRVRSLLQFERFAQRLPFSALIRSVDDTAMALLKAPSTLASVIALAVLGHIAAIISVAALGWGFGIDMMMIEYLIVVPIASLISSIPLTPGGWGIGEAAFFTLFEMIGRSGAMGVSVSISFRLLLVTMGLAGGIWLALPGKAADGSRSDRGL